LRPGGGAAPRRTGKQIIKSTSSSFSHFYPEPVLAIIKWQSTIRNSTAQPKSSKRRHFYPHRDCLDGYAGKLDVGFAGCNGQQGVTVVVCRAAAMPTLREIQRFRTTTTTTAAVIIVIIIISSGGSASVALFATGVDYVLVVIVDRGIEKRYPPRHPLLK